MNTILFCLLVWFLFCVLFLTFKRIERKKISKEDIKPCFLFLFVCLVFLFNLKRK